MTTTKKICKRCGNERTRLAKGYCKACVGSGVLAIEEKREKKQAQNVRTFEKLARLMVYIPKDSELHKAIELKREKSDITFSALALKALAQYLRVPTPEAPRRGRPELQEVAF